MGQSETGAPVKLKVFAICGEKESPPVLRRGAWIRTRRGIPYRGAVEWGEDRGQAYQVGKGGVLSDSTSWALEPSWKWMSWPSAWLALLKELVCICPDKRLLRLQTEFWEQSPSGGRDTAADLWAIFYFLVNLTKAPILQVEKSSHPVI